MRLCSAFCALALLGAAGVPASAQQTIQGRVLNAAGGMPIEDVTIRVVGEDLVLGTDSTGAFSFQLPEDRPGFALQIEVIGFATFNRTWMLPLERDLVIGIEREAVQLEGIDVEVDRGGMTPAERLRYRIRSIPGGIPRTATAADLRAFEGQNAEVLQFFPAMTVATGAGCESCLMASGRFDPDRWILDDREVAFDEFRSYSVGELCRIDVVTIPQAGSPTERGVVIGYTCDFMRRIAMGEEKLQLLLTNLWGN